MTGIYKKEVFNKKLTTVDERREHIETLLGDEDGVGAIVKKESKKGNQFENTGTGSYLESVANYLLESKDVDSGRKVENSFYRSEKDYRSNYSMGRSSYPSDSDVLDFFENASNKSTDIRLEKEYIDRLFDPEKLSEDDIRRFIIKGCNYPSDINKQLKQAADGLYDYLSANCSKGEKEILAYFRKGEDLKEVAKIKGVTNRAVQQSIKNICKKAKKNLRFFLFSLHYK